MRYRNADQYTGYVSISQALRDLVSLLKKNQHTSEQAPIHIRSRNLQLKFYTIIFCIYLRLCLQLLA